MTEVPIEIGYRAYLRLMRRKWDIVYHSKDLYFSHANKTLEPYYDMHTREYYGLETNPTRLAIMKYVEQCKDGPGVYQTDAFKDFLKGSRNYVDRVTVRKPFCKNRHQSSHPSLLEARREEIYKNQEIKPVVRELPPKENHPHMYSLYVEQHPCKEMVGRTWTHIYVPSPIDFALFDDLKKATGYRAWLREACVEKHDMIVVEPIFSQYYIQQKLNSFRWAKVGLKLMYAYSLVYACKNPQIWGRNCSHFVFTTLVHYWVAEWMRVHPLSKYKTADRFHDTDLLNELKYFREFVPTIVHRVIVLFQDEEGLVVQPMKTLKYMHLLNFLLLGYNYLYTIGHWVAYPGQGL